MAAWIDAWRATGPPVSFVLRERGVERPAVARGCEQELIDLLATMALTSFQEVSA